MDTLPNHGPVRGFTLIEVAVVVAVIAALMTLGLGFLNAQLASSAQTITKRKQEAVKEALIAFLGTHKRLPCPDVPNRTNDVLDDGSGVTGQEDRPSGERCAFAFGVVPYETLGLSRETATDGWSNFFSYRVFQGTTAMSAPAPPEPCGVLADWTQKGCFGAGKNGGLRVNDSAVIPPITTSAIAVVISHGPNGLGAWAGGTRPNVAPVITPETCEERRNANVDTADCTAPPLPLNTYFRGERENLDDIVSWLDAIEATHALSRQGVVRIAIAQLNEDLQALYDKALGVRLSAISSPPPTSPPDGCPTSGASTPESIADPWGNPYLIEPPPSGPTGFPIGVCSTGCPSCVPPVAKTCKFIEQPTFNGYLGKQGYLPPHCV